MGTGSFPAVKSGRGVKLTPDPLLVPWSRKSRAISLFPLWAIQPVQGCNLPLLLHSKLNCAVYLCKKKIERKTELNVLWYSTGFPPGLSVLCVFLCAWLWWIKTRLSFAVGFHEWTAQFSARKMTGKDSSEACAIACQNCAVYSVFPSGVMSHSKLAQFNWECIAPLAVFWSLSSPFWKEWYVGIAVSALPVIG